MIILSLHIVSYTKPAFRNEEYSSKLAKIIHIWSWRCLPSSNGGYRCRVGQTSQQKQGVCTCASATSYFQPILWIHLIIFCFGGSPLFPVQLLHFFVWGVAATRPFRICLHHVEEHQYRPLVIVEKNEATQQPATCGNQVLCFTWHAWRSDSNLSPTKPSRLMTPTELSATNPLIEKIPTSQGCIAQLTQ